MDSYSRFIEPTVHTQKIGITRSKEQLFKRRKDQAIPPTTRSRGSPCLKFDEKIAEAIMDQRSEIVNSICDEIQTDLRIQELIREDVFEVIHDYLGNRYKLY